MPRIVTGCAATGAPEVAGPRRLLARGLRWALLPAVLTGAVIWQAGTGFAGTLFDSLRGSWSGSGQIRYTDGTAEGIRCTAYYTGQGAELRLAIRCESGSNKVEIRGQLKAQGEKLSGTWEERTLNASGEASGRVSDDKMSIAVIGGGFKGAMSVSTAGGKQSVNIHTEGIKMKSVIITLGKS